MRTIDQYFDEFTSVNGSNIGYPVMYDYPENEPDPILDSYIQFEDPEAERVMVNAFGKNGKITYRQARNVTDNTWIQTFGISITGAKNWESIPTNTLLKNISKFNEFKYFTRLKNPFYITSDNKLASFVNSSLQEITYPDTMTMVPRYSCYNCTKLTKVTLGKNINNLGNSCFSGCTNLTTIIGGENLQIVNDYAFYNNTNLTNISGLDVSKLTNIGDYAFYHTKVYSNFIKDGLINLENIKGLKNTPFYLDRDAIPKDIKHVTLKLGKNLNTIIKNTGGFSNNFQVFDGDSFVKWSIELNPENKYLTLNKYDGYQVLLLPLKEVITNTKNFQKINKEYKPSTNMDNLFACMSTGLDENYPSIIKYPEGIEMMMVGSTRGIFQITDKLMTIVFPESLKHIGDRFMQYANSVETLVFKSTEPPLCNEIFMSFNKNLTKVYVPKASIDKYKNNFKYILGKKTNQQLLAIEDMPEDLKAKLL